MSSALLRDAGPLVGVQAPRIVSLPSALPDRDNDFGGRAVKLAELAGLHLDPWQQLSLRAMLRRTEQGFWAAYESCLLVPRQNGKSVVLEAFDLAKLYLSEPPHLILHTAHLFPTAMESYRHLVGLIKNTPELWCEVSRISKAHGEEGVELENGSRLRFAARTVSGSGRGFSPDTVVMDEAFRLPEEARSALVPALSAKPDPQLVYASSTGYPDSEVLWQLVERGRRGGDESLAFLEWSADPDLNLSDEDELWEGIAQANPALGYRLTERKIAGEIAAMRPEDRDRERLGLWPDITQLTVIDTAAWAALADPMSTAEPLAFAVEVSVDRAVAAIGVAGRRADGLWHVEGVPAVSGTGPVVKRGLDWVVPRCVELSKRFESAVWVIDGGAPANTLIEPLQAAGVTVLVAQTRDVGIACAGIVDAVTQQTIRHGPQPELDTAVAGAKQRPLGDGAFAFGRKVSSADITPLVAVTLAHWAARTTPQAAPQVWSIQEVMEQIKAERAGTELELVTPSVVHRADGSTFTPF